MHHSNCSAWNWRDEPHLECQCELLEGLEKAQVEILDLRQKLEVSHAEIANLKQKRMIIRANPHAKRDYEKIKSLEEKNKQLRDKLHSMALILTQNGNLFKCRFCFAEWHVSDIEDHKPECLAYPEEYELIK